MNRTESRSSIRGVIKARKCPLCGHHEIGFVTADGQFFPLKPGTSIQILEPAPAKWSGNTLDPPPFPMANLVTPTGPDLHEPIHQGPISPGVQAIKAWIPTPLQGNKRLRLKYGVIIDREMADEPMDPERYATSYLNKLQFLIEKEDMVQLAILLDKFFNLPHLATEDSRQAVMNIWQEIDEIREPVKKMGQWLRDPSENNLQVLTGLTKEDKTMEPEKTVPSEESLLKELQELTLEDFFSTLV